MDNNCVKIEVQDLHVGDLVYVVDSAHTYGGWCLGLVIAVHPKATTATTWLVNQDMKIVFGDYAKFLLVNRPSSENVK